MVGYFTFQIYRTVCLVAHADTYCGTHRFIYLLPHKRWVNALDWTLRVY